MSVLFWADSGQAAFQELPYESRRLGRFELTIHRLMDRSESFRDICQELPDAEFALSKVAEAPLALREARRAEWAGTGGSVG
jgi:hypothetical protein